MNRAHDWMFAQARRTPAAAALRRHDGPSIGYAELADRVWRQAARLRELGVVPGQVVGLCLDPAPELVVAMFAVLAAGGAFLPLEASHPTERLLQVLHDAGASLLLANDYAAPRFIPRPGMALRVVGIESDASRVAGHAAEPFEAGVAEEDSAYVMYTSGSTGRPKGVVMPHRALVNKIAHPGAWGQVSAATRAVLVGSMAFDAALAQIFLPLSHGGSLLLLGEEDRRLPERFWPAVEQAGVNLIDITPSMLAAWLDEAPAGLGLQRLVLGGESLPAALVRRLQALWPACVLVNAYGPTEACIDVAAYEVPPGFDGEAVPIGHALPNYRLQVLDAQQAPVAGGEAGELWVGGCGLASGYLGQPELSAERFVPDPRHPGERMYRTGDIVRMGQDGLIAYLGRADQQVKLRGQRIELEEIEAVLQRHPSVRTAAVSLHESPVRGPRLVAYVVLRETSPAVLRQVQRHAAERLPVAMVPAAWQVLPALPLTANGKLDRRALPVPDEASPGQGGAVAPRNGVERVLAELWSELLDGPPVGVHDNFFELGGHSLLSARLLARINARFSVQLSLADLLSHPTVAELALAVSDNAAPAASDGLLLALNRASTGAPLFCLPPLGGVGMVYAGLARELAGICPVQAFQVGGLRAGAGTMSMDDVATQFADALQRVQPQGPYRLLGYSAGGTVGHRLCAVLAERGEAVSHLFLVDPYHADTTELALQDAAQREERLELVCRDMIWEALGLKDEAADAVATLARRMLAEGGSAVPAPEVQRVLPPRLEPAVFQMLLQGVRRTWEAYSRYQPRALPRAARAVWMIQPDGDEPELRAERLAAWRALAGPHLRQQVVPGDHPSMLLRAETVEAVARCVSAGLQA